VLNAVPREKDVDVLGERALGAFYAGRNPVLPPAVGVLGEILRATNFDLQKSIVAVVGLGALVGKPVSMWLMRKVKGLHLLRSVSDFSVLKDADLVISGVGNVGLIKLEMLKPGAGVIDFGYDTKHETQNMEHETSGGKKIYGDFDTSGHMLHAVGFYTPTPGGTGPILVAEVFENFYKLNS